MEITARENCDYVNLTPQRNSKEFPINFERRDKRITTQALLTNNDREPKCCFCKQNHYHDKCTVVTDVESRKKIVYDNKLCLKCLLPSHVKKYCRSRRNCYICRSVHHHTAICDRLMKKYDGGNNQITHEETQTHHINAKGSV